MVENNTTALLTAGANSQLYWIIEHEDLNWAPGLLKEETKSDFIV